MKIEKTNEYFVICPNIIFDEYAKKIGFKACFLYLYLLRRRGSKANAFPSYTRISEDIGMSRAVVSKELKILEENCLIIKKRTASLNNYFINDKKIMKLNVEYYENSDAQSSKTELPELPAEFIFNTSRVQKMNYQSSESELKDRNIKRETIKRETVISDEIGIVQKIDIDTLPDDKLTKDQLIDRKTKKLASWSYQKAKQNNRLPVGTEAQKRWFYSNQRGARNWVSEYIDNLQALNKIIAYIESDEYWDLNYKSINNFNTVRTQLQEKHFKEGGK